MGKFASGVKTLGFRLVHIARIILRLVSLKDISNLRVDCHGYKYVYHHCQAHFMLFL